MKTKFPKQIVVTVENEGDVKNEFLSVSKTADEAAEAGVVKKAGIYVLKELVSIKSKTVVTAVK